MLCNMLYYKYVSPVVNNVAFQQRKVTKIIYNDLSLDVE